MKACPTVPIARPMGLAKALVLSSLRQGPRLPPQAGAQAPAGGEREEPSSWPSHLGLSAFGLYRMRDRPICPQEDEV